MSSTEIDFTPEQIVDENESLWRRIHYSWIKRFDDGNYYPSSAAFKGKDISVDIASKTTLKKSIRNSAALVAFLAAIPKKLGHEVIEAPVPDNPAHALIMGKIKRAEAHTIFNASEWVLKPLNNSLNS